MQYIKKTVGLFLITVIIISIFPLQIKSSAAKNTVRGFDFVYSLVETLKANGKISADDMKLPEKTVEKYIRSYKISKEKAVDILEKRH